MVVYNLNHSLKAKGLTLIEVLIALSIIAIAMTAIIKATTQNVRGTAYLQDKMIAAYVAQNVVNEARLNLIHVPQPPDKLQNKAEFLGQIWYWQARFEPTLNKRVKRLIVDVANSEDDDAQPFIELVSHVYQNE